MKKIFYSVFLFIFSVILSCDSSKGEVSDIVTVNFYIMRESEKRADMWYIPTVAVDGKEVLATFTIKRGEQIDFDNEIKAAVESMINGTTLYINSSYGEGYESSAYQAYTPKFIGDEISWCTSEDGLPTEENTIIFRNRTTNTEGTKILDDSNAEVLDLRCHYGIDGDIKYKKSFKYISSFEKKNDVYVPHFEEMSNDGTRWQSAVGVDSGAGDDTKIECVLINDNGYIDKGKVQYFGQGVNVVDEDYDLLEGYDVQFIGWGIPKSSVKITNVMQLADSNTFIKLNEMDHTLPSSDESWYFAASDFETKGAPRISDKKTIEVNYANKTALTVDTGDEYENGTLLNKRSYAFYPVYRIEEKST